MASPPSSPLQAFAKKLSRRSFLTDRDRSAIVALPNFAAQVPANRDFVRLGQGVDYACLIVAGLVGRFGQNDRGDRQIMAVHIPEDMPDLHSVVMSNTGSGLQALTVTTVLRVPHAALRELARSHPAVAEAFWRECVVDAAILAEWVLNVGRRRAIARLAHLLCEMAWRNGRARKDGGEFLFPATQAHLGDMTALTSVHVNRTIKSLREEGAARIDRGVVRVLDWDRLVEIGEFDPTYLQAGRESDVDGEPRAA